MKTTSILTGAVVLWVLAGAAPPAVGDGTAFTSLAVQTKMSWPPKPALPVELTFYGDFLPAYEVADLTGDNVRLTFWPPMPVNPPQSIEPTWELSLRAGCFVRGDTGPWEVAKDSCEVTLMRTAADGVTYDFTDDLVAVKGKVEPPTDRIRAYRMRLEVSFMLDDGTAMTTGALPGPHGVVDDDGGEAPTAQRQEEQQEQQEQ
jgi:hypothetical protein